MSRKFDLGDGSIISLNKSFVHPAFPEVEGKVRAHLDLGGHWVRPLSAKEHSEANQNSSSDENDNFYSEVVCISRMNPKVIVPLSMMKNVSAKEMPKRAMALH